MGIPILVRRHLYIETAPRFQGQQQIITSQWCHEMWLLIPALDTCFWHASASHPLCVSASNLQKEFFHVRFAIMSIFEKQALCTHFSVISFYAFYAVCCIYLYCFTCYGAYQHRIFCKHNTFIWNSYFVKYSLFVTEQSTSFQPGDILELT